ncbi:hypothetical protein BS78_04G287200 [Paspalum vaginatum]|nr:hypothetical protein BS78_04G287200 [Paspalum vaginatum]
MEKARSESSAARKMKRRGGSEGCKGKWQKDVLGRWPRTLFDGCPQSSASRGRQVYARAAHPRATRSMTAGARGGSHDRRVEEQARQEGEPAAARGRASRRDVRGPCLFRFTHGCPRSRLPRLNGRRRSR